MKKKTSNPFPKNKYRTYQPLLALKKWKLKTGETFTTLSAACKKKGIKVTARKLIQSSNGYKRIEQKVAIALASITKLPKTAFNARRMP